MKKQLLKYLLLTFFCINSIGSIAQLDLKWARKISGTDQVEQGNAIAIDRVGNVYVAGEFNRTTDFDPSAASAILVGNGIGSLFLAKYDSLGNYKWAFKLGDNSLALDLKMDKNGDLLLYGRFSGTVDFDPGANVANLTIANQEDGGFFAKYDTAGNYIWAKNIYSTYSTGSQVPRIATYTSGYIYITGTFTATKDFDPGTSVANLQANPSNYLDEETFFAKYTGNGDYVWAKNINGKAASYSICADNFGNVFITGNYYATVDYDPNAGVANLTAVLGSQSYYWDIFFAKYDVNGNYVWAKSIGGANMDAGYDIVCDSIGNIYVTGFFTGTLDFNPDPILVNNLSSWSNTIYNSFYAKYNTNGQYLWAQVYQSNNSSRGSKIVFDNTGDGYVIGTVYAGASRYQVLVNKYNAQGVNIWATGFGAGYDEFGKSMVVDTKGNLYISGEFAGTVNFGVSTVVQLTSDGTFGTGVPDAFFAKYKQLKPNNAAAIAGLTTVCAGQTNVVYTVPNILYASNYNWILPAGASITNGINTRTITVTYSNAAVSGTISVSGSNIIGSGLAVTISVTVVALPNVSVSVSDTLLCNAIGATITAYGATSYAWLPTAGLSASTISNPFVLPNISTTYTVTGTTSGCSSRNTVNVTIPTFSITGTSVICNGANALLSAIGMDAVVWANGPTTANYTVMPNTTETFTATGTTQTCILTALHTVIVLPIESNTITATRCQGSTYSFGSQSITTSGLYTQQLMGQNGCDSLLTLLITFYPIDTTANPQSICAGNAYGFNGHTYNQAGNYFDILSSSFGCDSVIHTMLTVNSIDTTANLQSICAGSAYSFNGNTYSQPGNYFDILSSSFGCDSIVHTQLSIETVDTFISLAGISITANAVNCNYQWLNCNTNYSAILGETNQTFEATANGDYAVMITTNNGCVDTSICVNSTSVGINNITQYDSAYELFPNPSNGLFYLKNTSGKEVCVIIYNVFSETVYIVNTTASLLNIDLSGFANGIYFLSVEEKQVLPKNAALQIHRKIVVKE